MSRTDIRLSDVFISWTGKDKELKDKIKFHLKNGQLFCTDSEESCQGNFEQWSKEAATSATIFLLILTENTFDSEYVPAEIQEALTMDDAANRIIIVCSNFSLYNKTHFKFGKVDEDCFSNRKISAVILPENGLTMDVLNEIYDKTTSLIMNRFDKIYKENTKPDYIKLVSLYKAMQKTTDEEFNYDKLYISRTVTEIDYEGNIKCKYTSPKEFLNKKDVFFLYGSAGCGKTQYINQIKNDINEDILLISLSCSKVACSNQALYNDIYEEFTRVLGNRNFYTEASFNRLIAKRHILLVLDGMDEIATERGMRAFLAKVEKYYKPNNTDITLFFTSRDIKNANLIALNGQKVRKLYLDDLTADEIEKLGNNLFLLFGAQNKGKEFYVSIQDLSNEIKSNPLLLSQLAIIYKDSGKVPETIVEIFDVISEMTFSMNTGRTIVDIPPTYQDMILNIRWLLKEFAKERYVLLAEGENLDPVEIFTEILRNYSDSEARASFLVNYLQSCSMLIDGEFYHKLLLEYFTAVYYYDHSFRLRKINNVNVIKELFDNYDNPYWAQVIQLYLIKVDSCINDEVTKALYQEIINVGNILDYTLLFDTCRDLIYHKEAAHVALLTDILYKSAKKIYPPYGPLFWYVPKYELYEELILSVDNLKGNASAVALVRDVCFIFGNFDSSSQVTLRVKGNEVFDAVKNELKGIRKALCEIFFLGTTSYDGGKDIYPRCFNVAETLKFYNGYFGIAGRMNTPFNDELGLYETTSFCKLNNELIGLISCHYDEKMKIILNERAECKLSGLILYSMDHTSIKDLSVNSISLRSLRVLYIPENCTSFCDRNLDQGLQSFVKIGMNGIMYQRRIKLNMIEVFENGELGKVFSFSSRLLKDNEVMFIAGSEGCGKTELLKQLNKFADNKALSIYFNCGELFLSESEVNFEKLLRQRINYYYPSVDIYQSNHYDQLILSFDECDLLVDQPSKYNDMVDLLEQINLFGVETQLKITLIFASRNMNIANLIDIRGKKSRRFIIAKIDKETFEKFLKSKLNNIDLSVKVFNQISITQFDNPLLMNILRKYIDKD